MSATLSVARDTGAVCWGLACWSGRHWRWLGLTAGLAPALWLLADRPDLAIAVVLGAWVVPALVCVSWARWWPTSWERVVAGPLRRRSWRRWAREAWPRLSRECGLSTSRQVRVTSRWNGEESTETRWTDARLVSVTTAGQVMTLTIRARTGQTAHDVTSAAGAIAAAAGAASVTARACSPSTARVDLVMVDHLAGVRYSSHPVPDANGPVVIGRAESSAPVVVDPGACLHVAVQGATRSGKSALCYGYLGALASRGNVLVCGIDPTGILLTPFQPGRGGAWVVPTAKDGHRVAAVLEAITDHLDERIGQLVAAGRDKITRFDPSTPVVLVVLEEYPGLLAQLAKDDAATGRAVKDRIGPKVERSVGRIIKEGAKVGITVLVLAQRMSAKAIDTDDRSNLPVRATLRVDNGDAVAMLHDGVDRAGIEAVRQFPPGRGLIEAPGMPLQRFQADITDYDTYKARVAAGITTTASVIAFQPTPVPSDDVIDGKAAS